MMKIGVYDDVAIPVDEFLKAQSTPSILSYGVTKSIWRPYLTLIAKKEWPA